MAVLVRPSKSESARQRVETLLRQWELSLEISLPRPVVLEGDLSEIDLGLDNRTLDWIERHCISVFHNAASLVFRGDDPDGEPYLSNVEGTRRMLELCRCTGIRQFHHVSTAYVCGLREGRVLESDVDVGQTPGNVYEKTKLQAEMLVRGGRFSRAAHDLPSFDHRRRFADWIHDDLSRLLRPAEACPHDGQQGRARAPRRAICSWRRWESHGDDRKNFVPVDWVSAVMCHIHGRPEFHGTTYHVTSPYPPLILEMAAVMQEVVEELSPLGDPDSSWNLDGEWFAKTFRDQLGIYGAYWRDDPQFDMTNTLPRRAAFAVSEVGPRDDVAACPLRHRREFRPRASCQAQAGVRRPQPHAAAVAGQGDSHGEMCDGDPRTAHLGIEVDGPGGGQWELLVRDGRLVAIDDGVRCGAPPFSTCIPPRSARLVHGELSVSQAVQAGQVRIEGNGMDRRRLEAVLQATATPRAVEVAGRISPFAESSRYGARSILTPLPPGLQSRGPALVRRIGIARRANDGCGQTRPRPVRRSARSGSAGSPGRCRANPRPQTH